MFWNLSAKIPDATQANVTGLQWFKIFQDGLTQSPRQWGTDRLFIGNGLSNFTIPSCLASGQYLLRAEVVGKTAGLVNRTHLILFQDSNTLPPIRELNSG